MRTIAILFRVLQLNVRTIGTKRENSRLNTIGIPANRDAGLPIVKLRFHR